MLPITPTNDNIERVVENLSEGLPQEGAPAEQGGVGADKPDFGQTVEALKQEGILDETIADESDMTLNP